MIERYSYPQMKAIWEQENRYRKWLEVELLVAINGARNAALLAAEILATSDEALANKLAEMREENAAKVDAADAKVKGGQR